MDFPNLTDDEVIDLSRAQRETYERLAPLYLKEDYDDNETTTLELCE